MLDYLIRADASQAIGHGHVMRCLVLAEAIRADGASVGFSCEALDGNLISYIESEGFDVHVVYESNEILPLLARSVIVDHYGLNRQWEQSIVSQGVRLICIDDLKRSHECSVLIDQGIGAQKIDYEGITPAVCSVLNGLSYALLRSEFLSFRQSSVEHKSGSELKELTRNRVLISMGGRDPNNETIEILHALESFDQILCIKILIGSGSGGLVSIKNFIPNSQHNIELHVDSRNVPALLSETDVAIGAPGGSAWERACLAVPSLLIVIAENQRYNANGMSAIDAAVIIGDSGEWLSENLCSELNILLQNDTQYQQKVRILSGLVDGLGSLRVVSHLQAITNSNGQSVNMRWVTMEDAEVLYSWQCASSTRKYSRNALMPDFDGHLEWMCAHVDKSCCLFLMAEIKDNPVGMLRLDYLQKDKYEVSILVAPGSYRQGLGRAILKLARILLPKALFKAYIKEENLASAALFESLGYIKNNKCYWSGGGDV